MNQELTNYERRVLAATPEKALTFLRAAATNPRAPWKADWSRSQTKRSRAMQGGAPSLVMVDNLR